MVYRSLLQKAVRRGKSNLVLKVIRHLVNSGDAGWLKKRTAVIVFEECWSLAGGMERSGTLTGPLTALLETARRVKLKDATGLGTLALALSQGDRSVLFDEASADFSIRVVSEAIRRPRDFWPWALSKCKGDSQRALVRVACQAHARGGWPWDMAFIQAAAFLAVQSEQLDPPELTFHSEEEEDFPLWIAIDKHTPEGKEALRRLALHCRMSYTALSILSFYMEGAVCDLAAPSIWWDREVAWRLDQIGLDLPKATRLWQSLRPQLVEMLDEQATSLKACLIRHSEEEMGLFDDSFYE